MSAPKYLWTLCACAAFGFSSAQAMEERENNGGWEKVSSYVNVKRNILEWVAYGEGKNGKNAGKLGRVCKEWRELLNTDSEKNQNKIKKAWCEGALCSLKLLYIDPNTKEKTELSLSTQGSLDLSGCGNERKHLNIARGYKDGIQEENKGKLEVWILRSDELETAINEGKAEHLKNVSRKFSYQYGKEYVNGGPLEILWTWGSSDACSTYSHMPLWSFNESFLGSRSLYGLKDLSIRHGSLWPVDSMSEPNAFDSLWNFKFCWRPN